MDYITTEDAAKELGVSVRRIQAMIRGGVLPAKKFGKAYAVSPDDVAWIKNTPIEDRKSGWTKTTPPPSKQG